MKGLKDTLASLSVYRRRFERLLESTGADAAPAAHPPGRQLDEHREFGSNPGNLKMLSYVPQGRVAGRPLVVALHGCTQTAAAYDYGSGWTSIADAHGAAVLFPEQQRANNPNNCFNWFLPSDTRRGQGEAFSIRQMIARMSAQHDIDTSRIYIVGLSAGGAMTAAMLAAYPDVFAGGAVIAGLPHGAATNMQEAFEAMAGTRHRSPEHWSDLVRTASPHAGPWPRLSVWHGAADQIVHPQNMENILHQWTTVHGLPSVPHLEQDVRGHLRRVWRTRDGRDAIEAVSIAGMAHGVPLATSEAPPVGNAGPFHFDVGVSSTRRIASFWGLAEAQERSSDTAPRSTQRPRPATAGASPSPAAGSVVPYVHHGEEAGPRDQAGEAAAPERGDAASVIAAALKAAGLTGQPSGHPLDPREIVTSTLRAAGVLKDKP